METGDSAVKKFLTAVFLIPRVYRGDSAVKFFLTTVFNFPGATEGIYWLKKLIYIYICPGSLRIAFFIFTIIFFTYI